MSDISLIPRPDYTGAEISFRRINYGKPSVISQAAVYVEMQPDFWASDIPFDADLWESWAISFWATDRASVQSAYSILRAFRSAECVSVASDCWPEGLAIGQLPAGKTLTINPRGRKAAN